MGYTLFDLCNNVYSGGHITHSPVDQMTNLQLYVAVPCRGNKYLKEGRKKKRYWINIQIIGERLKPTKEETLWKVDLKWRRETAAAPIIPFIFCGNVQSKHINHPLSCNVESYNGCKQKRGVIKLYELISWIICIIGLIW